MKDRKWAAKGRHKDTGAQVFAVVQLDEFIGAGPGYLIEHIDGETGEHKQVKISDVRWYDIELWS